MHMRYSLAALEQIAHTRVSTASKKRGWGVMSKAKGLQELQPKTSCPFLCAFFGCLQLDKHLELDVLDHQFMN
jgi:hypothetical protein